MDALYEFSRNLHVRAWGCLLLSCGIVLPEMGANLIFRDLFWLLLFSYIVAKTIDVLSRIEISAERSDDEWY